MTDLAGDESDSTSPSKRKEKRSSRRWSQSCGQSRGSRVGARPCGRDTRADELGIFALRHPLDTKEGIEEEVDRISVRWKFFFVFFSFLANLPKIQELLEMLLHQSVNHDGLSFPKKKCIPRYTIAIDLNLTIPLLNNLLPRVSFLVNRRNKS